MIDNIKDKKIIFFVGLPNSGKSTIAKLLSELLNCEILSSDIIREKYKMKWQLGDNRPMTILENEIRERTKNGENIIIDCCNQSSWTRINRLYMINNSQQYEKIAIYMDTPGNICIKREKFKNRDRKNTIKLIKMLIKGGTPPQISEGWNKIIIFKGY